MDPSIDRELQKVTADLDTDLLAELEKQSLDEIRKLRAHERLEIQISVVLQPANSSEVDRYRIPGETRDISQGGCLAVFTAPVTVGDVFRLQFDNSRLELPLVFARCLRCRFLREGAFEAAFSFFTPISLEGSESQSTGDLLD